MSGGYVEVEPCAVACPDGAPCSSREGGFSSRHRPASRVRGLRRRGLDAMPEMRACPQGTIGVAPRSPARPALRDTDAAGPAGVLRPVCRRSQSRPTSAQVLRRAPAVGSVGRGDGCSLAGCRGRRGPTRAGASPCGAGASAWLRSGGPARCSDLGRPGGTVGGSLGQNAAYEATVRTWTTGKMHQRLRCLRPGLPGSGGPDSRQVDRTRRRCGDDWIDARGLRGGAARSGGPGGLRVDGSARALTRLPAGAARVGALTPTAAAVSAVALGRRCPWRLVRPRHQPEANGLSELPAVQIGIPETPEVDLPDRASILVAWQRLFSMFVRPNRVSARWACPIYVLEVSREDDRQRPEHRRPGARPAVRRAEDAPPGALSG